jgi:SAM-dependent methyltransferase
MQKAEWEAAVGKGWAREWARTDRSFASLTESLVARILEKGAAHSILDIGCGAGELSLRLTDAKPGARILGIDVSTDLIEAARARVPKGARCDFAVADAAAWQDGWFYPDMFVSRHGVMFFDDPVAAFANLGDAAAGGARMVFSCFRDRNANPWAVEIAALIPDLPPFDPVAPGPFAFADSDRVRGILESAGWGDVEAEAVDFSYVAGAGDDPVADALEFFSVIGPAAPAIRALEGNARDAFLGELRAVAERHLSDGAVRFDAAAWIVTANRSE